MQVARTILDQLGGNRFAAMTGAHNFAGDNNSLQFSFKGSRKVNKCRVVLNSMDLYDVSFYKYNSRTADLKKVSEHNGIYCDMLQDIFTDETGLFTTL